MFGLQVDERSIQKSILQYLKLRGYLCWRNNTGAWKTSNRFGDPSRFIRFGKVGAGDIIGLKKNGQFFSIEVKKEKGKPTLAQERFGEEVKASNGIWFIAYSLQDVIDWGF